MKISELFKDKQFYKSLFTIALPIMLQNFINSAVNLIDTVMIGRLGTAEIAAVGLGNQIFFLYSLMIFGLCSGASIFTAQFWGKRDIAGVRKSTGFCLLLSLGGAFLFAIAAFFAPEFLISIYTKDPEVIVLGAQYLKIVSLSYIPCGISFVFMFSLRSTEKVRLPMITTIIALSLNAVLNYLLIFGIGPFPALGVAGAAITTVVSRVVELVLLVSITYIKKYPVAGKLSELFNFNAAFVQKFIRIVLPVLINEIIWSLGVSMQNLIFARTNTDAYAAFNIATTVNMLIWVFFLGLGNGVAVLIGKRIGEGNEEGARDYALRISLFGPLVAFASSGLLIVISRFISFVFNVNDHVIGLINIMFIIIAVMYPFRCFNMSMIVGICRAGGDTVFCVIYDVLFMWVFSLPLAAVAAFVFKAPVWVLFVCITSEEWLKAILGIWRLRSGKWLHNVTN